MHPGSSAMDSLKLVVEPWYDALWDPAKAQQKVLKNILESYSKIEYDKSLGADSSLILKRTNRILGPEIIFSVVMSNFAPSLGQVTTLSSKYLLETSPTTWVHLFPIV